DEGVHLNLKTRSTPMSETPISPLRARMIEDMNVRKFGEKTQYDYIRHVKTFSTFLERSPASATGDELRRYQVHQSKEGVGPATVNSSVAALRFFFRVTLDRPEMGRYLTVVPLPERLRTVLSQEEVARLIEAAPASSTRPRSLWPMVPACACPRSST